MADKPIQPTDAPLAKHYRNRAELLKVLYPPTIQGPEDAPDPEFIWRSNINAKLVDIITSIESLRANIFMKDRVLFFNKLNDFLAEVESLEEMIEEKTDAQDK